MRQKQLCESDILRKDVRQWTASCKVSGGWNIREGRKMVNSVPLRLD